MFGRAVVSQAVIRSCYLGGYSLSQLTFSYRQRPRNFSMQTSLAPSPLTMPSILARQSSRVSNLRTARSLCLPLLRRCESTYVFQEGDTALIQKRKHVPSDFIQPIHTKPLRHGGKTDTARGKIMHDDILGTRARSIVKDIKDRSVHNEYRVLRPTLGEYTNYTKRLVTPLYPHDASLIVSLLDINPRPPRETDDLSQKYEIFEAGTGHGALTLHLARAMQAFNPAPPPAPPVLSPSTIDGIVVAPVNPPPVKISTGTEGVFLDEALKSAEATVAKEEAEQKVYDSYKKTRRAVLNTLDIDPRYQQHARKIVRGFRQGMYAHNIDFHVGTIPDYLEARLAAQGEEKLLERMDEDVGTKVEEVKEDPARDADAVTSSTSSTTTSSHPSPLVPTEPKPFLEHVILDLPSVHTMLEVVSRSLKVDGLCLVFCPSITQIVACVKEIKEKALPFQIENTIEIGQLAGVGGRNWDVRAMRARSFERREKLGKGGKSLDSGAIDGEAVALASEVDSNTVGSDVMEGAEGDVVVDIDGREEKPLKLSEEEGWNMIARPKASGRIMGGGFVGMFRRLDY